MARFSDDDIRFMRRALALAARARGYVEPNPVVGAVVVRNGTVVGEGYHRSFGGPHAEVYALADAGRRARGATLYVTLEPCCHFGKTPPCTDAVMRAGISRVVAAMVDPFAAVSGKGGAILRKAGIEVDFGLLEPEVRHVNAPFIKLVTTGMPYVIAKWAQTLDGCIATATGESKWISSEASRAQVQVLRGRMDAIIVGIGTALADDPLLMARPTRGRDIKRLATRIVLDSECRLPPASQLVRTISLAPVMVFHRAGLAGAGERRRANLAAKGVSTVAVPTANSGGLSIIAALKYLGRLDFANVLVEGGPELLATFLRAKQVDEAHVYIAPKIIGGPNARRAVGGSDLKKLSDVCRLEIADVERIGGDLHVTVRVPQRSRR
jgi:diaminohydroxyphosphoribosylaminopyrimidine deaminase / 5-amino-6-(5-phosphoribosylamino)uracil reductase